MMITGHPGDILFQSGLRQPERWSNDPSVTDRVTDGMATTWHSIMANTASIISRVTDRPVQTGHACCHLRYLVMRPIVATSSSTLCRCSTTSPDEKAPATQCDT